MAEAGAPSRFLPTSTDRDLLRAGLAEPDAAVEAWKRWCQAADLGNLDHESMRLLPLAAWNLTRAGLPAADVPLASQSRRRALVAWELQWRGWARLLSALGENGIPVLILKGAALALQVYPQPGLRPMGDLDILVKDSNVSRAIDLLESLGYRPKAPLGERRRRLVHGENFYGGPFGEADLHWHLYPSRTHMGQDPDWWAEAQSFRVGDQEASSLGASDQLVHVLGHGLVWSPTPGHRWVADAAMLLRSGAVNEARVVAAARRSRVLAAVREGLGVLVEIGISEELTTTAANLLRALDAETITRRERFEHALEMRREVFTIAGEMPVYALRYASHARAANTMPTPWGFLAHVRDLWAEPDIPGVFRRIRRRSVAKLGDAES